MIKLAVVNLKGGTGKTTSCGYLCQAFHESGLSTCGTDADGENESLARWQVMGEFAWPVIGMAVPNLHTQLPGVLGDRFEVNGIDTPPMKENRRIVASVLRYASHVVIPVQPTPMDYDRLAAVLALVDEVAELRPDGRRPIMAALLTRTTPNASANGVYRELIEKDGVHVLGATIGNLQRYAQAFGMPIKNALNSAYGDAAMELLDLEVVA